MAGATRGKIKEHLEGIHKNYDWIQYHCEKITSLVGDKKPNLTEAMSVLSAQIIELDKLVQTLYAQI